MADKLNIEITQNKYTDLFIYDGSDRTTGDPDIIDLDDINLLKVTFIDTSPEVDNHYIYQYDNTKKAYVIPYQDFIPHDFSQYNDSGTLTLTINGTTETIEIYDNVTTSSQMASLINSNFTTLTLNATDNGGRVELDSTATQTGEDTYIQVVGGTLLQYLGWNIGIYRGNDFSWNDSSVSQIDFNFQIYPQDMNYTTTNSDNKFPETYWDVEYYVEYNDGTPKTLSGTFTEFTYKQTEIYRALLFEYISRNFVDFENVEQRLQTDMELFMQQSIYFDAYYKSFLASIEIGDVNKAYSILNYIIDYKLLNPVI